MKKRIKVVLAGLMTVGSLIGMATSVWPWRLYAGQEPTVVLTLSWLALLFTGLDGIMVVTDD